jgi:hypothetical protein
MRKQTGGAVLLAALVLLGAACGGDDTGAKTEQKARRTATSVANRAEAATRLTATLTGRSEAPQAGDPDGTGTATVNLDVTKGEACYEVSVQKLDHPVGMHIHEGEAGTSGPVVVALTTPAATDTTTSGCAPLTRALMSRMTARPGGFYVNVHTDTYPQGAVRGQLSQ